MANWGSSLPGSFVSYFHLPFFIVTATHPPGFRDDLADSIDSADFSGLNLSNHESLFRVPMDD